MILGELLDSLGEPLAETARGSPVADELRERLSRGERPLAATYLPDGVAGTVTGPSLVVTLLAGGAPQSLTVALSAEARSLLRRELGDLPVTVVAADRPAAAAPAAPIAGELAELLARSASLDPDLRAARLMDWIMERIGATRCALIPFEADSPGPPLAFHMRGDQPLSLHPRHVPRRIIDAVARARQPVVSHDVASASGPIPAEGSIVDQQVRSYLAVPVVFRGDLLAVAYVDRLDRPHHFTGDERRSFEAFAYELATPILALRDAQRAREFRALRDERLEGEASRPPPLVTSPALEAVLSRARDLAPHRDENLLILGETGVGKEVVARHIHELGGGAPRPFVAVNLGAIGAELFESELMGSVRGAFTGAVDRPGRIVQADGGTLFLDEIGDLPLVNQVKLLRFLQDRRVVPVGGSRERAVDVRVVAATNRDLEDLVVSGEFRADLYHRFAPPIVIPPLRARREEILPHARAWLRHKARMRGITEPELTAEAERILTGHGWPGNMRQLELVMSNATLLARRGRVDGALVRSLLGLDREGSEPGSPPRSAAPDEPLTLLEWRRRRDADERSWLEGVLGRHRGNAEGAARELGCPGSTLRHLLKKHGLRE